MSCPTWADDSRGSSEQLLRLAEQLEATLNTIIAQGPSLNVGSTSLDEWHGQIFHGLTPLPYYAGHMRGVREEMPCLAQDVQVGGIPGAPFGLVDEAVAHFDQTTTKLLHTVDELIRGGAPDEVWVEFFVDAVAWITARFIRIHPYLNGNGRVSRLLSNVLLFCYGFGIDNVRVNPRPDPPYHLAGYFAMLGEHEPMKMYLLNALAAN